jgi:hypothetical protein
MREFGLFYKAANFDEVVFSHLVGLTQHESMLRIKTTSSKLNSDSNLIYKL